MAFDPDAYLASKGGSAVADPPAFDPDAYLAAKTFDPDKYLASKLVSPPAIAELNTQPTPVIPQAAQPSSGFADVLDVMPMEGGISPFMQRATAKALDEQLGVNPSAMKVATTTAFPIPTIPQQPTTSTPAATRAVSPEDSMALDALAAAQGLPLPSVERARATSNAPAEIGAAVANTAVGAGNFMASPLGAATAALPGVPAVVQKAAAAAFAADLIPKGIQAAIQAPTLQGKVEGGLSAAMGGLAAIHAGSRTMPESLVSPEARAKALADLDAQVAAHRATQAADQLAQFTAAQAENAGLSQTAAALAEPIPASPATVETPVPPPITGAEGDLANVTEKPASTSPEMVSIENGMSSEDARAASKSGQPSLSGQEVRAIYYRGTPDSKGSLVGDETGTIWFTDDKTAASDYSTRHRATQPTVTAATLSLKNTLDLWNDFNGPPEGKRKLLKILRDYLPEGSDLAARLSDIKSDPEIVLFDMLRWPESVQAIKKAGYDSVKIHDDNGQRTHTSVGIFDRSQASAVNPESRAPSGGAPAATETAPTDVKTQEAYALSPEQHTRVNELADQIAEQGGDHPKALAEAERIVKSAVDAGKEVNWKLVELGARSRGFSSPTESLNAAKTEGGKAPIEDVTAPADNPFGDVHEAISQLSPEHQAIAADFMSGKRRVLPDEVRNALAKSLGPGAADAMEFERQRTTGLKRGTVDTERLSRGDEPIPTPTRLHRDEIVRQAEDAVDADKNLAPALISRIVDKGEKAITEKDAAVLLVERQRVINQRTELEEMIGRGENVEFAREQLPEIEKQLDRLDRAQRAAGSTWSDIGRMYQNMIREDYTLDALERKWRAKVDRPLTDAERESIGKAAKEIEAKQKEVEAAKTEAAQAERDAEVNRIYEATINHLGKEFLAAPKFGKEVLAAAEKIVSKLEERATAASERLRQKLGRTSAGVDPTILLDVSEIMAAKIGRAGLKGAELAAEMIREYGPKIKPYLKKAEAEAHKILAAVTKDAPKARKAVKRGVRKTETPTDVAARIKADAVAGDELSHKEVYDLARAHIRAGVEGVDAVMKAVHNDIKEAYPNATEKDVRLAFSEYGKVTFPSKEADKMKLAEYRTLVQLDQQIKDLQEGKAPLHTGLQRQKPTQDIRELIVKRNELLKKHLGPPSPERLASRDEARQTALRNAIADLDKRLQGGEKPVRGEPAPVSAETERLRAERDAMKAKLAEIEHAENPGPTPEERYNATRLKQVEKQKADIQARLAAGNYAKPPKRVPLAKNKAVADAEYELSKLKKEFNNKLFQAELKLRHPGRKAYEAVRDSLNTARAIKTAFDLSAVLRQGAFVVLGHPIRAAKAIPDMLRAMVSEKQEFAINSEILSRPNAPLYQSSKLFLHDANDPHLSKMEEAYMSRWAKKIPGVGASERAYTTFLNRLRADTFDALVHSVGGKVTTEQGKALANYINVATGRGNLAGASGAAISLNAAFFSPRFVVSRFELLAGQPMWRGDAMTRKAIAAEYARFIAGAGVAYAIGAASGASVETDPRKADFGKLKFGNTRVDFMAGLSQAAVFESRFANSAKKVFTGQKFKYGEGDFMGRFLRSKLSPIIGTAVDVGAGSDYVGKPVTPKSAAAGMVAPMSVMDIYDAMKEQGIAKGAAFALLTLLGASVSTYHDKPKSSAKGK